MSVELVVADDDETIREMIRFKVSGPERGLTFFENGRECWEYLEAHDQPDLVVLDVMMPGLSGLQILERIRNHEDLEQIPVIMLTSRGREEHVVEGLERGATDYMTKPFSPNELSARIERRLQ
jgi:DNA-binding response OmpR family regulator